MEIRIVPAGSIGDFTVQSKNSTFFTLATIMIWTSTKRFNLSIKLLIPFDMFLLSLTLHVRPVSPLFRLNWHKRSSLTNCFRWEKFPLELLTFPRCELLPIFQSNLKHINTIAKSVSIRLVDSCQWFLKIFTYTLQSR